MRLSLMVAAVIEGYAEGRTPCAVVAAPLEAFGGLAA
jgi:hypothetical protein